MRLILLLLLAAAAQAEDPDLAAPFARRGLTGTMVLASLRGGGTFVHSEPRARQRFIAASTFKIPNTLIGLDEKAVEDADSRFAWDGTRY